MVSKEPRIETLEEKKLVGQKIRMTQRNNKTFALWRGFMPRRKEIKNKVGDDLISMQVYDPALKLEQLSLDTEHDKWAAAEVLSFDDVPAEMETFVLPAGLYAVFIHTGDESEAASTYQYIFGVWLPASGYMMDGRPHFEIIGEKYKQGSPDSEEEIWVPIKASNA